MHFSGNTTVLRVYKHPALQAVSRSLGASLTLFWGRWGLPLPLPEKLIYIRGTPLNMPKVSLSCYYPLKSSLRKQILLFQHSWRINRLTAQLMLKSMNGMGNTFQSCSGFLMHIKVCVRTSRTKTSPLRRINFKVTISKYSLLCI